ncbi:hypothetical protein F3N42_03770 [Marinihelvus fidelis]|uniref:Uncharacterized protein n=1 Tax=Marinihelvus fidelis TaxID=2613842 RepID=A0A5N0TER1_9GAMM|nr:hypothetical protein [Marinihelvus fidelis]KAA9133480.1 hypothetical protein F3N42_03770 [Marinihelvus fidelis]
MLQLFEKIINEHGSSAILKERLSILKDAYADVEKRNAELQGENGALKADLENARADADQLRMDLDRLKGNFAKFACDHCGSTELKRTGNRTDPGFGRLGVKLQVFSCESCGKESTFMDLPSK